MDPVIDRLKQLPDGLDATGLDPGSSLAGVVRRGRRYVVAVSAASMLGVTAAVGAAVVAVPQVVQHLQEPQQPVVLATPEEGDTPAPAQEPTQDPTREPSQTTTQQDEPAVPADVAPGDIAVLDPPDDGKASPQPQGSVEEPDEGRPTGTGPDGTGPDSDTVSVKPDGDGSDGGKPDGDQPGTTTLTASQRSSVLATAPYTNVYSGTANPGGKVKVYSDHGWAYAYADDAGSWQVRVTFAPPAGETTFTVAVWLHDQPDVVRTFQLTTVAEEANHTFTAAQQRSTLDAAPYTNVYSGTANPGEKVKVYSDHGWAYAYADDAGNWQVQVTFAPPAGETTFPVTAHLHRDASVSRTFQLTTVADEAAAFTADQRSATVTESDPTNVYSGTGQPGHEVLVWTEEHGQATTVVAADGTWSATLSYVGVSAGDTFAVKTLDRATNTMHWFEVTVVE